MTSYPFNPGEHLLQTVHLTDLEDLAYRRLLDLYFTTEGPISLDAAAVARRTRSDQATVEKVLAEFFERTHAGWRHARAESVLDAQRNRAARAVVNGARGGRGRTSASAAAPPDQSVLTLSAEPSRPTPVRKNVPTHPNALRLAAMFHRKATTSWTDKEVRAFRSLGQIEPADLDAVEAYYNAHWPPDREKNILRHDLITFLNNFHGEVDRAEMWRKREKPAAGNGEKGFWSGSKAESKPTPTTP